MGLEFVINKKYELVRAEFYEHEPCDECCFDGKACEEIMLEPTEPHTEKEVPASVICSNDYYFKEIF